MFKKTISIILSGALVLGSVTAAFAATSDIASKLTDVMDTPYEQAVTHLVEEKVLSGYEDNTFRPENQITRAESVVLLMKAMNPTKEILSSVPSSSFKDMNGSKWAQDAVNYAVAKGIVTGYPDGTFGPTKPVTYAEFTTMLVSALGYDSAELSGNWPANYMNKAKQLNIFKDVDTTNTATFGEKTAATRGNVALMVDPVLEELATQGAVALPEKTEEEQPPEDTTEGEKNGDDEDASADTEKPYTISPSMSFIGNEIKLSVADAVKVMQTEGTMATQAEISKQADEIAAQTLSESTRKIRQSMDLSSAYGILSVDLPTNTDLKLATLQREFVKANIDNNYKADMNNIEKTAVDGYYNVLMAQEDLKIEKDNMQNAQDVLNNVKKKFELGTASQLEVTAAESTVTTAQATVKAKESALTGAKMSMNVLLGYPTMQNVTYTDSLAQMAVPNVSLTNAIQSALDKRNDIVAADFNNQYQQIVLDSLKYTTNTSSVAYKTQQKNVATAEFAVENAPKQIEADIRGKYISLQTMIDALDATKKGVSLSEENFRVAKIMYDAGLSTLTDVQAAQIKVYEANKALSSTISSYNLAVYDFNHAIDVGTTRIAFGG